MSDGPEPTPDSLSGKAIPAAYRRAPRTERFILTGVGIGAAIGILLGVILPAGTAVGRGTGAILVGLAGALAGGLVTGAQAAYLEYASGRSADRQRKQILESAGTATTFPDVWADAVAGNNADTDAKDDTAADDEGRANGAR